YQRDGRYTVLFWAAGACVDVTLRSDVDGVAEHAPHADQAVVLDGAPVQNGAVPHPDPRPDSRREPFIHVHDRAVLEIGVLTDNDRGHVPAQHRAVPHARMRAQRYVPQHDRAGSDERRRMDVDVTASSAGMSTGPMRLP